MTPEGQSASVEDEVERVARALFHRGSVYESVALLRGAIARDPHEERCQALLDEIVAGARPAPPEPPVALDLALVDRWIRSGMLVEALAVLGGAPMGSIATEDDWANMLGELLAPVPVDAEPTLVEMHRQLLRGGASVALTLLEERARRGPPIPAWAERRLSVLRWMLLDNASVAEDAPLLPVGISSPIGDAIRGAIQERNLAGAFESARALADAFPEDRDAARATQALATLVHEVTTHADQSLRDGRTIPLFGRPAAAMQLQMGNLAQAAAVYQKLRQKEPDDVALARLSEEVELVLRALAGEPIADDGFAGEATRVTHATTTSGAHRWEDETTDHVGDPFTPVTMPPLEALAPRVAPEESGTLMVTDLSRPPDMGPTIEMPSADHEVERLVAEGRLEEAESIYRGYARLFPNDPEPLRRAEHLRALRLGEIGVDENGDVVVRQIRPVK